MKTRTSPRCSGCGRRISRSKPDLILRHLDPKKPAKTVLQLRYHVRCMGAAIERVSGTAAA